jgi:hypothetical protein
VTTDCRGSGFSKCESGLKNLKQGEDMRKRTFIEQPPEKIAAAQVFLTNKFLLPALTIREAAFTIINSYNATILLFWRSF